MIIAKLEGGIGNQMFQYALARHLALNNQTEFKLDLSALLDRTPRPNFTFRDYDLNVFNIQEKFATPEEVRAIIGDNRKSFGRKVGNKLKHLLGLKIMRAPWATERIHNFDPEVFRLKGDLYLQGYWQSEKYFHDIAAVIRQDFSFKSPLSERGQKLAEEIKRTESVFLNVRHGDYVTNPVATKYHGVLSVEYYRQAIDYMIEKLVNPKFFVFSDDIDWCRQNLAIKNDHVFVEHEYDGLKFSEYLQLMSLCRHSIIANSSFAWWGAWLKDYPGKIVIAPRDWIKKKSVNDQDTVPDRWVRI